MRKSSLTRMAGAALAMVASRGFRHARALLAASVLAGLPVLSQPALASTDDYLAMLRQKEARKDSNGNPLYNTTVPNGTATGAYGLTAAALKDAGFISYSDVPASGGGEWSNVTWNDNPWGVSSRDDFLNNPAAQDAAMLAYTQKNWSNIPSSTKQWVGQTAGGMVVNESALLAGSHFLGSGGMQNFAACGFRAECIDPAAAAKNGMTQQQMADRALQYMADASGMDLSELTNGSYTPGGPLNQYGMPGEMIAEVPMGVGMPMGPARYREIPPFQGTLPAI